MGRIIVTEFVSTDGVMEAPGGEEAYRHSGWTFEFPDEGQYEYKLEELNESDVQLLGRVTYEGFAAAWPDRDDEAGFGKKMNEMPKYVVSTTLEEATWQNTSILRSIEDVRQLRNEIDGNILLAGSATLLHALFQHDLVDELRLMIFPVVLGTGKRAFPDDLEEKRVFELVDHRRYGSIVVHAYRRAGR
jgi:dihydrofolate reductase